MTDNLGSVRDVLDADGDVVNHIRYDAFGNLVDETAPGVGGRFRWTGREPDPDTGLQYNRARWYDPAVGRFLNPDPSGFIDGPNLYAYVKNRPTNFVDPTGLRGEDLPFPLDLIAGISEKIFPESPDERQARIRRGRYRDAYERDEYFQHVLTLDQYIAWREKEYEDVGQRRDKPCGFRFPAEVQIRPVLSDQELQVAYWDDVYEKQGILGLIFIRGGLLDTGTAAAAGFAGGGAGQKPPRQMGRPGRLGSPSTRLQIEYIQDALRDRGWEVIGGGGQLGEMYLPPPGGGRRGGAYPDITATKNGRTLHINTVDTLCDGVTPTARETQNAQKIRNLSAPSRAHLIIIAKPKPPPEDK